MELRQCRAGTFFWSRPFKKTPKVLTTPDCLAFTQTLHRVYAEIQVLRRSPLARVSASMAIFQNGLTVQENGMNRAHIYYLVAFLFLVLATGELRAANSPIPVTGWNRDCVVENVAGNPGTATQFGAGGDNTCWFEAGGQAHPDVFPNSRSFVSAVNANTTFQYQPYDQVNTLIMPTGGSGSLTLVTPATIKTLCILCSSTNSTAATTCAVTLVFTDSTTAGPFTIVNADWGNAGPATNARAIATLGRWSLATNNYDHPVNFQMFESDIAPNSPNRVAIFMFQCPATGIQNTGVMAISGEVFAIQSIVPNSVPPSTVQNVTINGSGFTTGATVKFGTLSGTNVVVVDSTKITVDTPSSPAGTVDVTVTNPDGSDATLIAGFSFASNPPPAISSITPTTGPTGGGTTVTIAGANFRAGRTVQFGGSNAFTTASAPAAGLIITPTQITCNTPAATPAGATGLTNVKVTNSDNTSATLPNAFQFTGPLPTVTGVTPNSGPYNATTNVTINGTGFSPNITNGGSVKFGNVAATNVVWVSSTKLTATVPAASIAGSPTIDVLVFNPDQNFGVGPQLFTYTGLRAPDVTTFTQPGLFYRYYRFANANANGNSPIPTFSALTAFSTGTLTNP